MASKHSTKIVPIGGFLEPTENNLPYPLNAWDQLAVTLYEQAHAQDAALKTNQLGAANYLNGVFPNWFANYDAGRVVGPAGIGDPNAPPPLPTLAVHVQVVEIEGSRSYDYVSTKHRVCAVPEYQKISTPQKH